MKKFFLIIILIGFSFFTIVSQVQPPEIEWEKTYGGDNWDEANCIIETTDGGYLFTGYTSSKGAGGRDVWVVKTDKNGEVMWDKFYGTEAEDVGLSVIETKKNDYVILARTVSKDKTYANIWVFKLDNKFNLLWEIKLEGTASEIIETQDGDYIIAGKKTETSGVKGFNEKEYLAKISKKGKLIWETDFFAINSEITSIVETNEGDFICTEIYKMYYEKSNSYTYSGSIKKIDKEGNKIWDKEVENSTGVYDISKTKENEFVISSSAKIGDKTYLLLKKIDSNGNKLFEKKNEISANDFIFNHFQTNNGDIVLYGSTQKDKTSAFVIKTDKNGVLLWQQNFLNYKYVNSAIETYEGFYLFAFISHNNFENKNTILSKRSEKVETVVLNNEPKISITFPTSDLFNTESSQIQILGSIVSVNKIKTATINLNSLTLNNSNFTYNAKLNDGLNTFTIVVVDTEGNTTTKILNINKKTTELNVDFDIPIISTKNKKRYALIIGNSDYSKSSANFLNFAVNDAKIFKQYAVNILGIVDDLEHIFYIENAGSIDMKKYIDNFAKKIQNSETGSEFFIYYSGHGVPDENQEAYLLPVDVSYDYISTYGIKLKDFYTKLNPGETKKCYFFIDACFSGGVYQNAKDIPRRTPKVEPNANILVLSAGQEDQISQEYPAQKHGIFTYFLLKTLRETKGNITFEALYDNIKSGVESTTLNPQSGLKEQNPQILINPSIQNTWKSWKVNP
jgi:hypothetical protein